MMTISAGLWNLSLREVKTDYLLDVILGLLFTGVIPKPLQVLIIDTSKYMNPITCLAPCG